MEGDSSLLHFFGMKEGKGKILFCKISLFKYLY